MKYGLGTTALYPLPALHRSVVLGRFDGRGKLPLVGARFRLVCTSEFRGTASSSSLSSDASESDCGGGP